MCSLLLTFLSNKIVFPFFRLWYSLIAIWLSTSHWCNKWILWFLTCVFWCLCVSARTLIVYSFFFDLLFLNNLLPYGRLHVWERKAVPRFTQTLSISSWPWSLLKWAFTISERILKSLWLLGRTLFTRVLSIIFKVLWSIFFHVYVAIFHWKQELLESMAWINKVVVVGVRLTAERPVSAAVVRSRRVRASDTSSWSVSTNRWFIGSNYFLWVNCFCRLSYLPHFSWFRGQLACSIDQSFIDRQLFVWLSDLNRW